MTLTAWRPFNTPVINLVNIGEENYIDKLVETFEKHDLLETESEHIITQGIKAVKGLIGSIWGGDEEVLGGR